MKIDPTTGKPLPTKSEIIASITKLNRTTSEAMTTQSKQVKLKRSVLLSLISDDKGSVLTEGALNNIVSLVNSEVKAVQNEWNEAITRERAENSARVKSELLQVLQRLEEQSINRKVISPKINTIYNENFVPLSTINKIRSEYEHTL